MRTVALLLIAAFTMLAASSASAQDRVPRNSLPQWLQSSLDGYEAQPADRAPLSIWQIAHNGKPAYFVVSPCCDQYNPLLSAEGEYLCSPSGGIVGRGDGRCPKPADPATAIKLVWIHPQSKAPQQVPPRLGKE